MKIEAIGRNNSLILFERISDKAVSNWIDQIKVTQNTRGIFSLIARKYTKDVERKGRKRWVTCESCCGIKEVQSFLAALEVCEKSLGIKLDWNESVSRLAALDWVMAAVIAKDRGLRLPSLPDIYTLPRQRTLRFLDDVLISVEWGYDMHDITLSLEQWIRILLGERYEDCSEYDYEGESFTADWIFDINQEDELFVGYDDGGEGWIGNLASIDFIEGPKILGIDVAKIALESINQ